MGLFDRMRRGNSVATASQSVPSSSLGEDLYLFGRFEIDPRSAPPDLASRASQLEPNYYGQATADPAAFTDAVSRAARARGSWAAYGGMRLVNSLLGSSAPGGDAVFELAFSFLRSRNINFFYLSPVEIDWWVKHHPGEDYLRPRELPPGSFSITPLAESERRLLVNLGPHGNNNSIYALARDGRYHSAVVYSGDSWQDANITETRDTIEQLYERLGEIVKYPRPGIDREFANYCPLNPPDFSP